MKISYAITVCNEFQEIQRRFKVLLTFKRPEDEIVVLFDSTNGTNEVEAFLNHYTKDNFNWFTWHKYNFDGHFANMKNKLTSLCSGDYIFQIDADEMISEWCLQNLSMVLQYNPIDVLLVPRINTVEGITQEHINKWGWRVDDNGWVNFPDYQGRIWRNRPNILWKNKVHEVLIGYQEHTYLPAEEQFSFYHPKTIDRQEKQNKFYDTI